jgi:hypothetical protein
MRHSIAHLRRLLVLAATCVSLAICLPALGRTLAPSPGSCVTAWNRGASPAQKRSVRHATGARVGPTEGTSSCKITFVLPKHALRIAIGAVVAGPGRSSGVWSLHRGDPLVVGAACNPNARLDHAGTLRLL